MKSFSPLHYCSSPQFSHLMRMLKYLNLEHILLLCVLLIAMGIGRIGPTGRIATFWWYQTILVSKYIVKKLKNMISFLLRKFAIQKV